MSEPIPAKPKYGDVRISTHPLWGIRIQAFQFNAPVCFFSKPTWGVFWPSAPEFKTVDEAEAWLDKFRQPPEVTAYYRRVAP